LAKYETKKLTVKHNLHFVTRVTYFGCTNEPSLGCTRRQEGSIYNMHNLQRRSDCRGLLSVFKQFTPPPGKM